MSGVSRLLRTALQRAMRGVERALPIDDVAGQVNMFVGPRARVTPRTSGFVGPEGVQRFEISDEGARLVPDALNALRMRGRARLGEVIDHPTLFDAYPNLRELPVNVDNAMNPSYGATMGAGNWSPRGDSLNLNMRMHRPDADYLSTILHEVQHAIQHRERMLAGGTPNAARFEPSLAGGWSQAYRRIAGEAEAFDTQARAGMSLAEREATPPALTTQAPDYWFRRNPHIYLSEDPLGAMAQDFREIGGDVAQGFRRARQSGELGRFAGNLLRVGAGLGGLGVSAEFLRRAMAEQADAARRGGSAS